MKKKEIDDIAFKLGQGIAKEGMISVFEYCKQFPWNNKKSIEKDIKELKQEIKELGEK